MVSHLSLDFHLIVLPLLATRHLNRDHTTLVAVSGTVSISRYSVITQNFTCIPFTENSRNWGCGDRGRHWAPQNVRLFALSDVLPRHDRVVEPKIEDRDSPSTVHHLP